MTRPARKRRFRSLAAGALLAVPLIATGLQASDACSTRAVHATANVEASDGSKFGTEALFRSGDQVVIRHFGEEVRTVAVEGPLAWLQRGNTSQAGDDWHKRFALGHQYHALLLYFEELVEPLEDRPDLPFAGAGHQARGGPLPYGGRIYRIAGAAPDEPLGFLFELPETPPIEVTFDDWREVGGTRLPYFARIDDGTRRFDYRYESVDLGDKPLDWIAQSAPSPDLDPVNIYRLHREILAAHCLGNADRIASLTAPETIEANRGRLLQSTRAATLERFGNLFRRVDYHAYIDRAEPVIEVSESGDIGWIAVEVTAVGAAIDSGEAFRADWAWIMLVRRMDGRWLNAGNASNAAP